MKLTKIVYQNNKIVNTFEYENEQATNELINVLFNKIDKKYTIKINKDPINKTIKIDLYFTHNNNKYKYNYTFTNVNERIDLR